MNERPIIFSGSMVSAILADTKTQTRRVVKPQPEPVGGEAKHAHWSWRGGFFALRMYPAQSTLLAHCPYGAPGDRLWVKETYANMAHDGDEPMWTYKAGSPPTSAEGWSLPPGVKWKSGRFMPKAAARITLELTDVRVERLQEISEADAYAEGIEQDVWDQALVTRDYSAPDRWFQTWTEDEAGYVDFEAAARRSFQSLWDSINAKRAPWSINPWLWVLCFRRRDDRP